MQKIQKIIFFLVQNSLFIYRILYTFSNLLIIILKYLTAAMKVETVERSVVMNE